MSQDPAEIQAALAQLQATTERSRAQREAALADITSTNMSSSIASSLPGIDTSALSGLTGGALSNAASSVSGAISGAIDGIAGQASGMLSGAVGSVSNMVNGVMGQAANMASGLLGSASSILGSSLGDIANSFPSAAKDMFGAISDKVGSLGSIAGDILKGPKEVDSMIKSLSADSAEAIQSPVAFISKPMNDVIKGVENMAQGSSLMDSLAGMTEGAVSNLSSAIGKGLSSVGDITGAISSVTNEFAGAIGSGISSISGGITSAISGVIGPVTSSIGGFASSLVDGIKSTIGSGTGAIGGLVNSISSGLSSAGGVVGSIVSGVKSVVGSVGEVGGAILGGAQKIIGDTANSLGLGNLLNATGLGSSALSKLPQALLGNISNRATSAIVGAASDFMNSKMGSYSNVLQALTGTASNEDLLMRVMGLGGSYPSYTIDGAPASNLFGNNSLQTVTKMYKAASGICPNVSMPSNLNNYSQNKDMFDVLMGMSADMGMSDLLRQLMACNDNQYADNRTITQMKYQTSSVAMKGDVNTYLAMQEAMGAYNISNPKRDSQILVANMKGTASEKTVFQRVLDNFSLKGEDLTTQTVGGRQTLDGRMVTFMTAAGTDIVDGMVGTQNRKLIQAAMYAFS